MESTAKGKIYQSPIRVLCPERLAAGAPVCDRLGIFIERFRFAFDLNPADGIIP